MKTGSPCLCKYDLSYEEEDTCMSYEEECTCMSSEEEDTCSDWIAMLM